MSSKFLHSTVVHAPHFFPWPPLIGRLMLAESVVFLDHLPFKKGYFQNRTLLQGKNGAFWCTVPVTDKNGCTLREIRPARNAKRALSKMSESIRQNYGSARFSGKYLDGILDLIKYYERTDFTLTDISMKSTLLFFDVTGVPRPKTATSSDVILTPTDRNRMLEACVQHVAGRTVLNGFGASSSVHDVKTLAEKAIDMRFLTRTKYSNLQTGLSYIHYLLTEGESYFQELATRMKEDYAEH